MPAISMLLKQTMLLAFAAGTIAENLVISVSTQNGFFQSNPSNPSESRDFGAVKCAPIPCTLPLDPQNATSVALSHSNRHNQTSLAILTWSVTHHHSDARTHSAIR